MESTSLKSSHSSGAADDERPSERKRNGRETNGEDGPDSPINELARDDSTESLESPESLPSPLDHLTRVTSGDGEPIAAGCFQRSDSPAVMERNRNAIYGKVGEEGVKSMHRFSLYETSTRYYLVGQDVLEKQFRVLQIDRTSPPGHLNIFEDEIIYDRREMSQLLMAIEDGNKAVGGMKLKCTTWGLLGFTRFTESYYMMLITKRTQVAMLGGHYVYQIEATEMIPLTTGSSSGFQRDRNPEETRYLSILANLDFTKNFYFSYSYNITRTLQKNMIREREAFNAGLKATADFNDMFVWNHHLLDPAMQTLQNPYDWCIPIIHGYIEQASLDVFGRRVYMTVIARRSRYFAGARFLKRGTNDVGYVANDVETEQIVSNIITTSFHAPGPKLFSSPTYTSYVQHRGSIPLYWTQDNTGVTPKPDIDLNLNDPFYTAAAMHFDDLFERYGAPIYVLNLIKARERTPRESKLLEEYYKALVFLNQALPNDKKILYKAFDMSRAAKTRGQDVIGTLENIAELILEKTGFFHNGDEEPDIPTVQNGVARTNCIDCLDRTNAAQFVIGKRALGRQLKALGVIAGNTVEYDTDAVNMFTHMFHSHGDTIAIQYGGSHLVNTMSTYRKINEWKSHSRDMVESFKRYYHNSFLDAQRQEAYNLFLGNYIFAQGQPMLWDLATDYYLHHTNPRLWYEKVNRSYIDWYTPKHLEPKKLPPLEVPDDRKSIHEISKFDDYWLEYYKPLAISSFAKIFAWKLSSRPRYLYDGTHTQSAWDPSPFVPRKTTHQASEQPESPGKKPRKGVTIIDPYSDDGSHRSSNAPRNGSLAVKHGILRAPSFEVLPYASTNPSNTFIPPDRTQKHQWSLNQFHQNSLNPAVTPSETQEYERYINHPLNLPLVISSDLPENFTEVNADYVNYVASVGSERNGHLASQEFVREEDLIDYMDYLNVADDPLTVFESDGEKKRYKAYRQWLRGKSLFKQSKVDPEHISQS